MSKKRLGRPRKTDTGVEKLNNRESVRLYAKRMRQSGLVRMAGWVKTETRDEIQRMAKSENCSAGDVIERAMAVLRSKESTPSRNALSDS